MIEQFRVIPGFPLYEVGDHGSVRSRQYGRLKTLKPIIADGRCYVTLSKANKERKRCRIHTLVLTAFIGPRPAGKEACHFPDRNTSNNNLSNLRWDTKKANSQDQVKHGTNIYGSRVGTSKLTDEQVISIRQLSASLSEYKLASLFGVTQSNVSRILSGQTWRHLLKPDNDGPLSVKAA